MPARHCACICGCASRSCQWGRNSCNDKSPDEVERSVHVPDVRVQLIGAPQLGLRDSSVVALERREAALLALIAIEGPTARSKAAACCGRGRYRQQRSSLRQRSFCCGDVRNAM